LILQIKNWLAQPVSTTQLAVFRILFGFLLACESFGAIATGWVKTVFIDSKFTFNFIGFEFLQALHGEKMYAYYVGMGILGILICIGKFYRISMFLFTLMWSGVYLAQKEHYNNHYYFLMLLCFMMNFIPAHCKASFDAKQNHNLRADFIVRWLPYSLLFIVAILYFYAALAKFYPDWLDGTFAKILLEGMTTRTWLLEIFTQKWFLLLYSYFGIVFDLLVIVALIYRPTRKLAFLASFVFHISNAITLKIGIFPFLALSFLVFFVDENYLNKKILRNQSLEGKTYIETRKWVQYAFVLFFILQLLLPLRHYFIQGNVFWTEEGHRLSWRMMLREKQGTLSIRLVDKETKKVTYHNITNDLTHKQQRVVATSPDMLWQYCQYLKKINNNKVSVYADCHVSLNRRTSVRLVNPDVDMAAATYSHFKHNSWITPQEYW
jgi:vitamin K-dependent gamma-carboxylase